MRHVLEARLDVGKCGFETLLADGYEGVATVEHWGSRWLMLEGVRQTAALLGELQG